MHDAHTAEPKGAAELTAQGAAVPTWQTSLSARTRLTMARQPLHCTPPESPQCFMALTIMVTPSCSPTCARTCTAAHNIARQCALPSPNIEALWSKAKNMHLALLHSASMFQWREWVTDW